MQSLLFMRAVAKCCFFKKKEKRWNYWFSLFLLFLTKNRRSFVIKKTKEETQIKLPNQVIQIGYALNMIQVKHMESVLNFLDVLYCSIYLVTHHNPNSGSLKMCFNFFILYTKIYV